MSNIFSQNFERFKEPIHPYKNRNRQIQKVL